MINLILFLFPAGLSLKIKDDLFKEKLSIKDYILTYVKYALFINLIVFTVLYFYSIGTVASISYALDNIDFIFKYLIIAVVLSIIIPFVDEYIKKNVSLKVNFKQVGKKDDKKNK